MKDIACALLALLLGVVAYLAITNTPYRWTLDGVHHELVLGK